MLYIYIYFQILTKIAVKPLQTITVNNLECRHLTHIISLVSIDTIKLAVQFSAWSLPTLLTSLKYMLKVLKLLYTRHAR